MRRGESTVPRNGYDALEPHDTIVIKLLRFEASEKRFEHPRYAQRTSTPTDNEAASAGKAE
jgi:hypothetical protein